MQINTINLIVVSKKETGQTRTFEDNDCIIT